MWAGALVSSLLIVGLAGCGGDADSGITQAAVGYGPVAEIVEAPATVTPKAQITVDAAASGSVAQLLVSDGQHVDAGQALLRIDSPEAKAQLDAAKAADAQAASQSKNSSGGTTVVDFTRSQSLADSNAKKAFDAAQSTADQIADPAIKASILEQISSARSDYATASSDVRNTIGNFNKGFASVSDVLGSLGDAQRTQTQAAVAIAQKTVDSLTIKASIAGTVSLRSGIGGGGTSGVDVSSLLSQLGGNLGALAGDAGGLAAAAGGSSGSSGSGTDTVIAQGSPVDSGAPLLVLTDSSALTLTAQVDETAILRVAPGVTANVQLDAVPDANYAATVLSVDSQGQSSSRGGVTYRVRLSLQPGTLGDGSTAPVPRAGMSAVADLKVADRPHVLSVPAAAVVHDGDQDIVWQVTSGVVHRHVVRLGAQGDTNVEIASGLNAGDMIVTAGADKVHDGQKL
ncbi:HlyD family efflux transporter periplasmic adaptor subunit [Catenulispora yoronensis]|uniref:HlyD family efflux transporter periplasmic adaptor subunit n=1 Tax=Catenulispora yoronensis TaxID=450799 RepID=A0ABP5FZI4_9ACTN